MIPPPQAVQQGEMMRRLMLQGGQGGDPLHDALSRQAALAEMMKERASHNLRMYKIRMKYGPGPQAPGPSLPGQGAVGPQGQTMY